ncbi:hypothetical protein WMY93_028227 [Mugilogobius chulae]|uniref:Uncharacterized protein n=1 Tax=Mugilogobius chulae TaxID=88201 RepID=A0AAW0MMU2_9GOBI
MPALQHMTVKQSVANEANTVEESCALECTGHLKMDSSEKELDEWKQKLVEAKGDIENVQVLWKEMKDEQSKTDSCNHQSELMALQDSLQQKDVVLENQHSRIKDLEQIVDELYSQLEDRSETLQKLQEQRLEDECSSVSSDEYVPEGNLELTESTELVRNNLLAMAEEDMSWQDQTKGVLAQVESMQAEMAELQKKEKELKKECNRLKSELKDFQEQLESARVTIWENEGLIKKQDTEMGILRRINASLTEESFEQKALNDQLRNKEMSLVEKNNKAVSKVTLEMVQLKRQVEEAQLVLLERDELIEKQSTKMTDLEKLVHELYNNLNDRRRTIQELRQQLDLMVEEEIFRNLAAELPFSAKEEGDFISNVELEKRHLLASVENLEKDQKTLKDQNDCLCAEVAEMKATGTCFEVANAQEELIRSEEKDVLDDGSSSDSRMEDNFEPLSQVSSPQMDSNTQVNMDSLLSDMSSCEEQLPTVSVQDKEKSNCEEREEGISDTDRLTQTELPDSDLTPPDLESPSTTTVGEAASSSWYSAAKSIAKGVVGCGSVCLAAYLGYKFGSQTWNTCDPLYLSGLSSTIQPPYF